VVLTITLDEPDHLAEFISWKGFPPKFPVPLVLVPEVLSGINSIPGFNNFLLKIWTGDFHLETFIPQRFPNKNFFLRKAQIPETLLTFPTLGERPFFDNKFHTLGLVSLFLTQRVSRVPPISNLEGWGHG